MVKHQIEARGVVDERVLNAMRTVPREAFVSPSFRGYAFSDSALPISEGQTISQPYMVAFMTEALHVDEHSRVLEIGTGSGYQSAVFAEIVEEVYTVEIVANLARSSRALLTRLGYENIFFKEGDGYFGWAEQAPFDAIMVTAAPDHVPSKLLDQLKPGGRMAIPIGPPGLAQELFLYVKTKEDAVHVSRLMAVRFVPFTRASRD